MSQIVSNCRPAVNARRVREAGGRESPAGRRSAMILAARILDSNWRTAAPNHSPKFYADERAFPAGMRILAHLAAGYLEMGRGGTTTASAP